MADLNDHELSRLERGEAHEDINNPLVNAVPSGRLSIALNEIGFPVFISLEGPLAEEIMHECPDFEADLRP